jgi:hypothetical protein
MNGLHVLKQPMFYQPNWNLAFYNILQMDAVAACKAANVLSIDWVLAKYHIL